MQLKALLLGLAVCAFGCDSALSAADDDDDTNDDAGAGADAAGKTPTQIRFANLSPDSAKLDWCLAAGGDFTTAKPLLAANGNAEGVSYPQVSKYVASPLPLASGELTVRLVQAGSADCASKIGEDSKVSLFDPPGLTFAAIGHVTAGQAEPSRVVAWNTFTSVADSPRATRHTTKIGHAALGVGPVRAALTQGEPPAGWEQQKDVTALGEDDGYYDNLLDVSVVLRTMDASNTMSVFGEGTPLEAGKISLFLLIGDAAGGKPLEGLFCDDLSVDGNLTRCTTLPKQ